MVMKEKEKEMLRECISRPKVECFVVILGYEV